LRNLLLFYYEAYYIISKIMIQENNETLYHI